MADEKSKNIPLNCKPFLSMDEAVAYSGITREKLTELTNPMDCPFVLWIAHRRMVKRELFDEYIKEHYKL